MGEQRIETKESDAAVVNKLGSSKGAGSQPSPVCRAQGRHHIKYFGPSKKRAPRAAETEGKQTSMGKGFPKEAEPAPLKKKDL